MWHLLYQSKFIAWQHFSLNSILVSDYASKRVSFFFVQGWQIGIFYGLFRQCHCEGMRFCIKSGRVLREVDQFSSDLAVAKLVGEIGDC